VPRFALPTLLAALDYRRRTGQGQYIDISQLEAALHFMAPPVLDYANNGHVHTRVGNRHREQGDAGGYAATGISSTSRSMSGYQRLKMAPNSPLSVRTRVCNNKWAPSLDHCICCFLQNRLLTTSLTVDSTKPVAIASPL
jgi:hypothetical protein